MCKITAIWIIFIGANSLTAFDKLDKMNLSDDEIEVSTQEEDALVEEMVRGIIILDNSKKPFKRSDMKRYLSKTPKPTALSLIIEKAKAELKAIGLSLVEGKDGNSNSYILISNHFPMPSMFRHATKNEIADRTLLVLVLSFIFIRQSRVTDVELLSHLSELHIYNEASPIHPYFGDVKKVITNDFVEQLYLEKIIDKELDVLYFLWGQRAEAEVTKRSILEFICNIGYDRNINPQNLASFYKIVEEEESLRTAKEAGEGAEIRGGMSSEIEILDE